MEGGKVQVEAWSIKV